MLLDYAVWWINSAVAVLSTVPCKQCSLQFTRNCKLYCLQFLVKSVVYMEIWNTVWLDNIIGMSKSALTHLDCIVNNTQVSCNAASQEQIKGCRLHSEWKNAHYSFNGLLNLTYTLKFKNRYNNTNIYLYMTIGWLIWSKKVISGSLQEEMLLVIIIVVMVWPIGLKRCAFDWDCWCIFYLLSCRKVCLWTCCR